MTNGKSRKQPVIEYFNVYTREFSAGHESLQSAKEVRHPDKLGILKLVFDKVNKTATVEVLE